MKLKPDAAAVGAHQTEHRLPREPAAANVHEDRRRILPVDVFFARR